MRVRTDGRSSKAPDVPPAKAGRLKVFAVLPGVARRPCGGFRVAYEYANRLAESGHEVSLYHDVPVVGRAASLADLWNLLPGELVSRQTGWFHLDPRVRSYLGIPGRRQCRSHPPDVYLLTAWQTARHVGTLYPPHRVVHLVHDYEFWHSGNDELRSRIRKALSIAGVRYVATSTVVAQMLGECGSTPVATIRAGLDRDMYHPDTSVGRRAGGVGILLRRGPLKGTADALSCLDRLRAAGQAFQAIGTGPAPAPASVLRLASPDDAAMRTFYSQLEVFVSLSPVEAWGLPALEAMACGAAVVLADNIGCRDFARDGENCVIVPPGRPDLAAKAVKRLLSDPGLRARLVEGGAKTTRSLDWARPVAALAEVLRG